MRVAVFQFSFFGINTYIVYDPESKECAIIDPGMSSPGEEKAIVDFIENNSLIVKYIVNTHLHIDHVVGNKFLIDKYGVPVVASPNEEMLGNMIQSQAMMFGVEGNFDKIVVTQPVLPGEILKLGNEELKVVDVSGHSPGGIALYSPADHFVIVGDALFDSSIGRTDLPGGKHFDLIKNIRKNLFTLPEETIVFPGHGPSTSIGKEKATNPFF